MFKRVFFRWVTRIYRRSSLKLLLAVVGKSHVVIGYNRSYSRYDKPIIIIFNIIIKFNVVICANLSASLY